MRILHVIAQLPSRSGSGVYYSNIIERTLTRANSEFQPEVVILHRLWMLTSMAVEIFDDKIKIGVCHNTDIRQAEQHPEMKNKYVANLCSLDAVFSLSDSRRQKIADVFDIERHRIITMGGGFNQNLFFPPESKAKNAKTKIVFAAKIEKSKGVFELVKAFKKISRMNPNVHLDVIGQPNKEKARTLDLLIQGANNITLVPIKCQKVLADYIRDKDIFVMPSYFEGLGLMAIECLANGLRVVAIEIDALMELLGACIQ